MDRQEALTMSYNGLSNRIIIPVLVTNDRGMSKEFPGLIDTGATNTCVSLELASELGLVSIGVTESGTAGGKTQVNVYIADLSLCQGRVHFPKHKILSANLTEQPGVEMLIGMDILIRGDFALTHQNGKTVASFRIPSLVTYDFIPQANNANKFAAERARRAANQVGRVKKRRR
jgi:predicted aspartyl protease